MKIRALIVLAFLSAFPQMQAAPITGTVRTVSGDTALIAMEGDVMPPVGAKAEIFFKIAGVDEEISVATGHALAIDHGDLKVKIENATGAVEKGQTVRFSGEGAKWPTTPNVAISQPNKSSTRRSIVGQWNRQFVVMPFIFSADGKMSWEEKGQKFSAKYRIDAGTTPAQIDVSDFDHPEMAAKGAVLHGIFEIQSDGRLRLQAGPASEAERPTKFSEDAEIYERANDAGEAAGTHSIIGKWLRVSAMKETYTFTADGTIRTHFESRGMDPIKSEYRYRLDQGTTPAQLNFYFGEINDDPSFRGILEFQSDDAMRLDGKWTKAEGERPTVFGDDTYVFSRAP